MRSMGFLSARRGAGELGGHCVREELGTRSERGMSMRSKGQRQLNLQGAWKFSFAIRYRHGLGLHVTA